MKIDEHVKSCKVSTDLSANYLDRESTHRVKRRTDWGNDNFKAIILRNMEGYQKEKKNVQNRE